MGEDLDGEFLLSVYWLNTTKGGTVEQDIVRDLVHEQIG